MSTRLSSILPYCLATLAGCASPAAHNRPASPIAAPLAQPRGIALDRDGNVYTGNFGNHLVVKIMHPPRGPASAVVVAGTDGKLGDADGIGTAASFSGPIGLAVDDGGNIFVADSDNHQIRKITPDGTVTTIAGKAGSPGYADGPGPDARFDDPTNVAVDHAGNVYVSDNHNQVVRKISPAGLVSTLAGTAGQAATVDGVGANARFDGTRAIAIDDKGNLYVACEGSSTIRKITPAGVVTTLAGQPKVVGSQDGTGSSAMFNTPRGLTADSADNVYVADTGNQVIRKITPSGVVTALAGMAGQSGFTNGNGAAARFNGPRGVAVDRAGNVYVADSDNDAIRLITPEGEVTTIAQPAAK